MKKLKLRFIWIALPAVAAVLWLIFATKETPDQRRAHKMVMQFKWAYRLRSTRTWLPIPLKDLLGISKVQSRCLSQGMANEAFLLTSGYLTNATITITNFPITANTKSLRFNEVKRRMQSGPPQNYYSYYSVESTQVVITCCVKDFSLIRKRLTTP